TIGCWLPLTCPEEQTRRSIAVSRCSARTCAPSSTVAPCSIGSTGNGAIENGLLAGAVLPVRFRSGNVRENKEEERNAVLRCRSATPRVCYGDRLRRLRACAAGLSEPTDTLHPSVRTGRQHGVYRAAGRSKADRGLGPAGGHRLPRRCQYGPRHRGRGEIE